MIYGRFQFIFEMYITTSSAPAYMSLVSVEIRVFKRSTAASYSLLCSESGVV